MRTTKFENKININDTLHEDKINIYILFNDPEEAFPKLDCNCESIGQENIIICDEKILNYINRKLSDLGSLDLMTLSIEDSLDSDIENSMSGENIEKLIETRFQLFLLQWILGHEIGHIILNHEMGLFYNVNAIKNYDDNNTSKDEIKIYMKNESEADSFAVVNLNGFENQNAFWYWIGVSNMINFEDGRFLGDWAKQDFSIVEEYRFNPLSHPPWIVRYLDMVDLLLNNFPDYVVDKTGYFDFIRSKIKLILTNENINYPFCH